MSGNYLDLNGDCLPELVLLRSESKQRWLDVWTREVGGVRREWLGGRCTSGRDRVYFGEVRGGRGRYLEEEY